jgi:hypothetical protein
MASNEEIIRDLYVVAEKEPKRFRSYSPRTATGGTFLRESNTAATTSLVPPTSTRLHFRTCTAHSTNSTSTVTSSSFSCR